MVAMVISQCRSQCGYFCCVISGGIEESQNISHQGWDLFPRCEFLSRGSHCSSHKLQVHITTGMCKITWQWNLETGDGVLQEPVYIFFNHSIHLNPWLFNHFNSYIHSSNHQTTLWVLSSSANWHYYGWLQTWVYIFL